MRTLTVPHMYVYKRIQAAAWKARDFVVFRVLHMDDTPHRIALSVSIGVFVAWMPMIGLQMVAALLLCTLLRANRLIGVPLVWLSNPFTIIPIYYPSYRVGVWLAPHAQPVSLADWRVMVNRLFGQSVSALDRLSGSWGFAWEIACPLWLGSVLMGVLVGAIMYWITYVAVVRYRRRMESHRPSMALIARR